ncbi:hypothetical protein Vafri_4517 [Volvox africanus]|uniref:OTU domain-containing protein n=1 Tax=Volvox africanus TaxID=51714 RepID=A0A8J4AUI0_9CHLO|nr:hypothetical protein Vafri_4517 [Volvox africanus]
MSPPLCSLWQCWLRPALVAPLLLCCRVAGLRSLLGEEGSSTGWGPHAGTADLVLLLIRNASRLPDVAQLLATATRHLGNPVSVLGCLASLTSKCRAVLDWDSGRHVPHGAGSLAVADLLERQRKMAKKVIETQTLLQAVLDLVPGRSAPTTSAATTTTAEADRLIQTAQELRTARGASSSSSPHGMPTSHHRTGTLSYSGGGSGGGSSNYSSNSYDGRYVQTTNSNVNTLTATAMASDRSGARYDSLHSGGNRTYGNTAATAPPAAYATYPRGAGVVSRAADASSAEDVYGVSTSRVASVATGGVSQAAQYTVETLRQQQELQRLTQAAAGGASFTRDGLAQQSQSAGRTSPYDPMVTSTMPHPWRIPAMEPELVTTGAGRPQQQQQQQHESYGYMDKTAMVHSQRGYSVPSTPQRSSTAPLNSQQLLQLQHQHQQLLQQQSEERQQQLLQQLEALSERLQQLSPSTTSGRYLGGYSVGGAATDATQAAASRSRSTARLSMPSADVSFATSQAINGSSGWGNGSILGTGGGLQTRQQAWADPPPWQTAQQSSVQGRPLSQLQSQYSSARVIDAQDAWRYPETAEAGTGPGSNIPNAASAASVRPSSASRMRAVSMDNSSPYAPAWSTGGRVTAAWTAAPAEVARMQLPQQGRSGAAASSVATATAGRPTSVSRDMTRRSLPQPHPPRAGSSSVSSSGSSGGGGGGSSSSHRRGGAVRDSGGGTSTLRALAADSGLIPGLPRSPRQHYDQHTQPPGPAQPQYEPQQPSRRQSAPRTSQHTSTAIASTAEGSSRLESHNNWGQPAEVDPRNGVTATAASAPPLAPLSQYGMAETPSTSGRRGTTAVSVTAGAGAPVGSSGAYQRSGWDASASAAAAAAVSSPRELPQRRESSGNGGGAAAAMAQQQLGGPSAPAQSEPHRAPASVRSPAARPPASLPLPGMPPEPPSGGISVAASAPVLRAENAEVLRSGALAEATNLSGRRRMTSQPHSHYPPSSSYGGAYDDEDTELQLALQISRHEAEAAAAAVTNMRTTGTESAAANAVAAMPSTTAAAAAAAAAGFRSENYRSSPPPPPSNSGSERRPLPPPPPPPSPPASPPLQRTAAVGTSTTRIDEGGGGGMLVGGAVSLQALQQRYASFDPLLSAKLVSLEDDFPRTRRVAGDGNCFYRAALFALMEQVMTKPDGVLCDHLETVVQRHVRRLEALQDAVQATAGCGRSRAATPERGGRSEGGSGGALPSLAAGVPSSGGVASGADLEAYKGGRRLLRLLRTAWFKEIDAAEPSDLSSLERLFNHSSHSTEVISFARNITVHEMLSDEAFYEPFIPGCGGDYAGLSLKQICVQLVRPMGVEVEQPQIIALCRALGATLGVLDVAGSQVGAIKHGPREDVGPPVAWVAHLPGHYDVVYPARPLDVGWRGELVPLEMD